MLLWEGAQHIGSQNIILAITVSVLLYTWIESTKKEYWTDCAAPHLQKPELGTTKTQIQNVDIIPAPNGGMSILVIGSLAVSGNLDAITMVMGPNLKTTDR